MERLELFCPPQHALLVTLFDLRGVMLTDERYLARCVDSIITRLKSQTADDFPSPLVVSITRQSGVRLFFAEIDIGTHCPPHPPPGSNQRIGPVNGARTQERLTRSTTGPATSPSACRTDQTCSATASTYVASPDAPGSSLMLTAEVYAPAPRTDRSLRSRLSVRACKDSCVRISAIVNNQIAPSWTPGSGTRERSEATRGPRAS